MTCLCRLWCGAHPSTSLMIYNFLVRSHLDFETILFGRCSQELLKQINKILYQIIHVVLGNDADVLNIAIWK